ncbi:hypothetical protein ACJX0J_020457, partial [Zea mays]
NNFIIIFHLEIRIIHIVIALSQQRTYIKKGKFSIAFCWLSINLLHFMDGFINEVPFLMWLKSDIPYISKINMTIHQKFKQEISLDVIILDVVERGTWALHMLKYNTKLSITNFNLALILTTLRKEKEVSKSYRAVTFLEKRKEEDV